MIRAVAVMVAVTLFASACGSVDVGGSANDAVDCIVRLHGRNQRGRPTVITDRVVELAPSGNATYGIGRQWLYAEQESFDEARTIVAERIADAGCDAVVVNGFSNGGAFAARLYCDGVSFDGTLRAVVIDDPVADAITNGCNPAEGVPVTLYWSGALEQLLPAGTNCADVDFECAGSLIIGIEAMAGNLDTEIRASIHDRHAWYREAPEILAAFD